jgi:hypothetical protein
MLASLLGSSVRCCNVYDTPEISSLKMFKLSTTDPNLNITTYCCGDKPECPNDPEASDTCWPASGCSVFEK